MARTGSLICHILTRETWEKAVEEGGYQPPSLQQEGFIHFSYPHQTAAVGRRFYTGQSGLVLLWVDPARVKAELRIEQAADVDELFPHLYGPLNLDAVVDVTDFLPDTP